MERLELGVMRVLPWLSGGRDGDEQAFSISISTHILFPVLAYIFVKLCGDLVGKRKFFTRIFRPSLITISFLVFVYKN